MFENEVEWAKKHEKVCVRNNTNQENGKSRLEKRSWLDNKGKETQHTRHTACEKFAL